MPIYEYYCEKCDKKFEFLVIGNDTPACPDCQTTEVNKLMSACGFFSKGDGGQTVKASAGTASCSGCAATSCASCGH